MPQPWFQPPSARPNAAVDFPFIAPVWTISSGRFLRCLVVSPSSGTVCGTPCGIVQATFLSTRSARQPRTESASLSADNPGRPAGPEAPEAPEALGPPE